MKIGDFQEFLPEEEEDDTRNLDLRMALPGILGREKVRKSLAPLENDLQIGEKKEDQGSPL